MTEVRGRHGSERHEPAAGDGSRAERRRLMEEQLARVTTSLAALIAAEGQSAHRGILPNAPRPAAGVRAAATGLTRESLEELHAHLLDDVASLEEPASQHSHPDLVFLT